jgi:hypothetical protein
VTENLKNFINFLATKQGLGPIRPKEAGPGDGECWWAFGGIARPVLYYILLYKNKAGTEERI